MSKTTLYMPQPISGVGAAVMVEDSEGQWVKFSDYESLRAQLKNASNEAYEKASANLRNMARMKAMLNSGYADAQHEALMECAQAIRELKE